ncbi:MAG: hypothetical protein LBB20_03045 [Puniceicoccales bacterium]|jgi:hypothetical protein|nr:hypothetical protein [Puniceicoccales bacterium]
MAAEMSDTTFKPIVYEPILQFSIILDNKIGKLNDLVRLFHNHDEHILAISVIEHADIHIIRTIPSYPEETKELLKAHSINFVETKLIGIELVSVTALTKVMQAIAEAEININYMYSLLVHRYGHSVIVASVDDAQAASTILRRVGLRILGQSDIIR